MNFLKCSLVALACLVSQVAHADDVMVLTPSKSSYNAGESALLQARSLVKVQDPKLEIFFTAQLDGTAIPVQVVDSSGFSITPALSAGTHYWVVQLYLRDAKVAKELNDSILFFQEENARIDSELATATDPTIIANLQKEKARNLELIAQAQDQLTQIRTAIGTAQTLSVEVSE